MYSFLTESKTEFLLQSFIRQKIRFGQKELISRFIRNYFIKVTPNILKAESKINIIHELRTPFMRKKKQLSLMLKKIWEAFFFVILDEKVYSYLQTVAANINIDDTFRTQFNKKSKFSKIIIEIRKLKISSNQRDTLRQKLKEYELN